MTTSTAHDCVDSCVHLMIVCTVTLGSELGSVDLSNAKLNWYGPNTMPISTVSMGIKV